MNLKSILKKVNVAELDAGGAMSAHAIKALGAYRKQQFAVFLGVELVIIAGVMYSAYFISQHPHDGVMVKLMTGAIGIGAGGGIELMRRTWKEWSRTDLLLTLITDAPEQQVRAVVDKLVKAL